MKEVYLKRRDADKHRNQLSWVINYSTILFLMGISYAIAIKPLQPTKYWSGLIMKPQYIQLDIDWLESTYRC